MERMLHWVNGREKTTTLATSVAVKLDPDTSQHPDTPQLLALGLGFKGNNHVGMDGADDLKVIGLNTPLLQ